MGCILCIIMHGWMGQLFFVHKNFTKKNKNIYKPWDFLLGISAKKQRMPCTNLPMKLRQNTTHLPYLAVAFREPRQSFGARSVRNEEIHEEIARDSVDFPTIHGWNCGAWCRQNTQLLFTKMVEHFFVNSRPVNFCFTNSMLANNFMYKNDDDLDEVFFEEVMFECCGQVWWLRSLRPGFLVAVSVS